MALTDQKRLIKLDEQIIDLEYLFTRELMREEELNKHTLLLSRGLKHRIDKLRSARAMLRKKISKAPTYSASYHAVLAERKEELRVHEDELSRLKKDYETAMARMLFDKSEENATEVIELSRAIKSQKTRTLNKERAVQNWMRRITVVKIPESREMRTTNIEQDLKRLGYNPEPIKVEQFAINVTPKQQTPEDILGSNPNWNLCPAVNSASLELITQPTKQGESNE